LNNRGFFSFYSGKRDSNSRFEATISFENNTDGVRATWVRVFDGAHHDRRYQLVSPEGDFLDYATTKAGGSRRPLALHEAMTIEQFHRVLGEVPLNERWEVVLGYRIEGRNAP